MAFLTRDSLRIIHVDDDSDFPRLMDLVLRRAGFTQIVHFSDALIGLNCILSTHPEPLPHVVFIDVQMPRLTGFEVLTQIRQRYGKDELALFLVTSSYDPQDKERAKAAGATGYLDKMRAPKEIVSCLDGLISERNHTRHTEEASPFIRVRQIVEFPRRHE